MKLIKLAVWLALAGICYGAAFHAGWLILSGIAGFFALLAWSFVASLISSSRD